MNYESIILELMNRIQTLEQKVSALEAHLIGDEEINAEDNDMGRKNTKTTLEMINACYEYGKKSYLLGIDNFVELAEKVSLETGMKQSSAQMYIVAVNSMLHGNYFNRIINSTAAQLYFNRIEQDFGKKGLQNAISAMEQHICYLNSIGNPAHTLRRICNEYKGKL